MTRKTLIALLIALLMATTAYAATAFFVREIHPAGMSMTKQCVYDYLGETYIITISSASVCPVTIEVDL